MSAFDLLKKEKKPETTETLSKLRVVVTSFYDDSPQSCAEVTCRVLSSCAALDVVYDNSAYNPEILSLESRNFYDLVDKGRIILKRSKAQVLIWGYRVKDMLRLNFQTPRQYEKTEPPSFSLLESLYLPISYFQTEPFPRQAVQVLCAAVISAADEDAYPIKRTYLEQLIGLIENEKSPANMPAEALPYIQNMLAQIYITAKDRVTTNELKTASALLEQALKNKNTVKDALLLGNIYANFGQLYHRAAVEAGENSETYCQHAVECRQYARKYFNKHVFPFDYGQQTFALSRLYFIYWQQTADSQSLRDAVFYLREAEKIFSKTAFPFFWAEIETDLGAYLAILSAVTENEEIVHKAVECYENRQKIYTKDFRPLLWAKTAVDIGELYFSCGKRLKDASYLTSALSYLEQAEEIYENMKYETERSRLQIRIKTLHELLEENHD